jgi:hypothetical protein
MADPHSGVISVVTPDLSKGLLDEHGSFFWSFWGA